MPAENEIRAIIEARKGCVLGGCPALVENMSDNVVTFDVVGPLRGEGKASARERAAEWPASYAGPVAWEERDVRIIADGDVAFSHGLSHVTGTLKSGDDVDMWFRTTLGFRRIDGRWLIMHEHGSDPFDPATGKASLELKP